MKPKDTNLERIMLKLLAEINLAESKAVKIKTPYIVVPMNLLNKR
jgi:hypothetical protein